MGVVARFYVDSLSSAPHLNATEHDQDPEAVTVKLTAVNRCAGPNQDEEDEDSVFGYYTPHGEVSMTIRGQAGAWFRDRLGKKVAVYFDEPK